VKGEPDWRKKEAKKDPCRRRGTTRVKSHLLIRASGINYFFSYILPEVVAYVNYSYPNVRRHNQWTVDDDLLVRFGELVEQVLTECSRRWRNRQDSCDYLILLLSSLEVLRI